MDKDDIPLGLSIAMAEKTGALEYFSLLTDTHKKEIIDHTHEIGTKEEMKNYVNSWLI